MHNKATRILFITNALDYTGAPRSTLRMCRVAMQYGYDAAVWSPKEGPFIQEFDQYRINVSIVDTLTLNSSEYKKKIKSFDLAICNTIITSSYVRIICRYIPTIWYIREAKNLDNYLKTDYEKLYMLRHFDGIYCVSEYAATIIKQYTNKAIRVIHNCVEDESCKGNDYIAGTGSKIKFIQLGTIIQRKGYDILLDAFQSLPAIERDVAELYIAGGYTKNDYADTILKRIDNDSIIHYCGVLTGDAKTRMLSDMDVVIVASRDESCSLVALEATMLSKPLIVTETVGAKYMVNGENGIIVKAEDSNSLRAAIQYMIENKNNLAKMGAISRTLYNEKANMNIYTKEIQGLFLKCKRKNKLSFKIQCLINRVKTSYKIMQFIARFDKSRKCC